MFFLITFLQQLGQWDQSLFKKINSQWTNPVFDSLMPFMRSPICWVPVYIFLLVFVLINFKAKGLWWSILFLSTIALTDLVGNYVLKHNFQRLRPCNDPDFYMHVRLLLKQCGSGYSFISNHAANHFGMATFLFVTFRKQIKKWIWIAFPWAFIISYAQVYVGVHYPGDVMAGMLLGLSLGSFTGYIFNKRFGFAIFDNQPIV